MIRVAVDALGGDHAPEEIVGGAVAAVSDQIRPTLFGPSGLDTHDLPLEHIVDHPKARALARKRLSSVAQSYLESLCE